MEKVQYRVTVDHPFAGERHYWPESIEEVKIMLEMAYDAGQLALAEERQVAPWRPVSL